LTTTKTSNTIVDNDRISRKGDSSTSTAATTTTTTAEALNPSFVDSWTRVVATTASAAPSGRNAAVAGRGSISGWISCPLCEIYSKKKYAFGRGLADHLRDVHTPWRPSKLSQKIHRRQHERQQRQQYQEQQKKRPRRSKDDDKDDEAAVQSTTKFLSVTKFEPLKAWDPTEEEQITWNERIVQILRQAEEEQSSTNIEDKDVDSKKKNDNILGTNRTGQQAVPYKDSLPPLLKAASEGNLIQLKQLVCQAKDQDTRVRHHQNEVPQRQYFLRELLHTTDRHKSAAEHWAAGGGHVHCLHFLDSVRAELLGKTTATPAEHQKLRRRDGKTCLHYAARNGHINCIRYLLNYKLCTNHEQQPNQFPQRHAVDERSGEGTTPLHLACYGGQFETVKFLIEDCGANVHAKNDWGCSVAHWVAMTISNAESDIRKLCTYLLDVQNVSFVESQGQGHTVLHKASHRGNRHVIRWMADSKECGGAGLTPSQKQLAGAPDLGGHKPSDIWRGMIGDDDFAMWMETEMGW
jgi:hypothetical protein